MSIITVSGTVEYYLNLRPCKILIDTDDDLATVMTTGYLNGSDTTFNITYAENIIALVTVTDKATPIWMGIDISGSDISLIAQDSV